MNDALKQDVDMNVTHYEMIIMVVSFKIWGPQSASQKISPKQTTLHSLAYITKAYTRDCKLVTTACNIWLLTAHYGIELQVSHVSGKAIITADLLSRWGGTQYQVGHLNELVLNPHLWLVTEKHFIQ